MLVRDRRAAMGRVLVASQPLCKCLCYVSVVWAPSDGATCKGGRGRPPLFVVVTAKRPGSFCDTSQPGGRPDGGGTLHSAGDVRVAVKNRGAVTEGRPDPSDIAVDAHKEGRAKSKKGRRRCVAPRAVSALVDRSARGARGTCQCRTTRMARRKMSLRARTSCPVTVARSRRTTHRLSARSQHSLSFVPHTTR